MASLAPSRDEQCFAFNFRGTRCRNRVSDWAWKLCKQHKRDGAVTPDDWTFPDDLPVVYLRETLAEREKASTTAVESKGALQSNVDGLPRVRPSAIPRPRVPRAADSRSASVAHKFGAGSRGHMGGPGTAIAPHPPAPTLSNDRLGPHSLDGMHAGRASKETS